MKKLSSIILAYSLIVMPACNDNRTETASTYDSDTTVNSADQTAVTGSNSDTMNNITNTVTMNPGSDSSFIKEALNASMMEVELGKVATQKAKNRRVKNFASMMVTDHSKAINDLKQLASGMNITVAGEMDSSHKRHIADMKKLSGDEFEKHYMSMMVDDHQKDIASFNNASRSSDNNVKNFATKTLPVLQKHMDSATAIKSAQ
jgi:putative membrane protein